MNKNIFTSWTPDPAGTILGTGYHQFTSRFGVKGLAKEDEDEKRLDILAVESLFPGRGDFRKFIHACKQEYKTIGVWEVFNPILERALLRYGFTRQFDFQNDEIIEGFQWDRL